MGLLTNANSSQGLLANVMDKLVAYAHWWSWISYAFGVAFIFLMPIGYGVLEYSHKTYFSENALLPGLVKVEFNMEHVARQYLEDLREEAQKTPYAPPFPWIEARLKQLGLEVYRHNFTLNYPLGKKNQVYKGDNIYAVLRAPRASSTEGLVLSTPYRPPDLSFEPSTDVSVALLLTMAKFFRHQKYWAKDIIFLITQHEQLGMQAWLEAYHRTSCGYVNYGSPEVLDHGDLEARAGSLQAAINLDMSHEKFTHLNVKVEGLNGQLPNLDLFNLVTRLSTKEGLRPMVQGIEDSSHPGNYFKSLKAFVSMAVKQAAGGVPSGNHGLFHRFGIEALTIESVHISKPRKREFNLYTAGRIMEGIFRSLNNLLERFHQSFFFYLLPSTSRYVSIGMYMPGFGLLAGSMLIRALGLWYKCILNANASPDTDKIKPLSKSPQISEIIQGWILCHLWGIMMLLLPRASANIGTRIDLPTDYSVLIAILAYCIVGSYQILKSPQFGQNWRLLKCITLLEISILSSAMALSNFSLAYIVTLFMAPVSMLIKPSKSKKAYVFSLILMVLTHPLSLIFGFCAFDTVWNFPDKSIMDLLSSSIDASIKAVMFSITDGYIYGNYAFVVGTVCLLPCWLLNWRIANEKCD